jgi:hypothetical protein
VQATVVGLALVSHSGCAGHIVGCHGSCESVLQAAYYGHPQDCYELRIEEIAQLSQPQVLLTRQGRIRDDYVLPVTVTQPLFLGCWGETSLENVLHVLTNVGPAAKSVDELTAFGTDAGDDDKQTVAAQLAEWNVEGKAAGLLVNGNQTINLSEAKTPNRRSMQVVDA